MHSLHAERGKNMKNRRFIDVDVCINRLKKLMSDAPPDEQLDYFILLFNEIETEFHAQEAEQELFLKLPCKVGDYVYQIDRIHGKIDTKKVAKINLEIMSGNDFVMLIWFETSGHCFSSHFGKTVFFNKIDALKALEEHASRKST
jgi:hypothetical protein